MEKIKKRRGQRKASAWSRSLVRNAQGLTFRDVAVASVRKINAKRGLLPKCGATARSTGEQCRNVAMENGKCRVHGGKTPKGDQWHKLQFDVSGISKTTARLDQKLIRAEKAAEARRLRLKRATAAERQRYEKWLADHMPGSAARRAAKRLDQRIAQETRSLKIASSVPDPRTQEIIDRLAELKARKALYEQFTTGVFA